MNQSTLLMLLTDGLGTPEVARLIAFCTGMSPSMAYRTLNGQRKMTFDEGEQLMAYSYQHSLLPTDFASERHWKYSLSNMKGELPAQYIDELAESMHLLDPQQSKLWLTSYEIPIFYYMQFPELMVFKLFFWAKTVWLPYYKAQEVFEADEWLTPGTVDSIQSIYNQYCSIESVEYLNTNMCVNTARQLNYARDVEWFKSFKQYKNLISQMSELLDSLKRNADEKIKTSPFDSTCSNSVVIKENEVYFTNNIYLIESNSQKRIFSVLDNPNYLSTSDAFMVERIEQWFTDLDQHSIAISQGSERDRKLFFERVEFNFDDITM